MKPKNRSGGARKYISPDNQWDVSFTNFFEYRMGSYGWKKLELKKNGENVTRNHSDLVRSVSSKRFFRRARIFFRYLTNLVPWSYDSRFLMLIAIWEKKPLILYDVIERRRILCPVEGFPISAQWDPTGDHNAIIFDNNAVILNSEGKVRAKIHWPSAAHEMPLHSGWLRDGSIFFVISVNPKNNKTEATFFKSNGELQEILDLDPTVMVPFDEGRFACIDRDGFSLVINNSTAGVGAMLYSWHDIRFDQKEGVLQLATYRPSGMPYKSHENCVCNVEEIWLAVDIGR